CWWGGRLSKLLLRWLRGGRNGRNSRNRLSGRSGRSGRSGVIRKRRGRRHAQGGIRTGCVRRLILVVVHEEIARTAGVGVWGEGRRSSWAARGGGGEARSARSARGGARGAGAALRGRSGDHALEGGKTRVGAVRGAVDQTAVIGPVKTRAAHV